MPVARSLVVLSTFVLSACQSRARTSDGAASPEAASPPPTVAPAPSTTASSDGAGSPPTEVAAPDDLSTDEAVGRAVTRVYPQLGLSMDPVGMPAGFCVIRPPAFSGLVLAGISVLDIGCLKLSAFYRGRAYASVTGALPAVLAAAGWAGATPEVRQSLGLAWALDVAYVPGALVTSASDKCLAPGAPFRPPLAQTLPGGDVRVTAWMDEERAYFRIPHPCQRHTLTFTADGASAQDVQGP